MISKYFFKGYEQGSAVQIIGIENEKFVLDEEELKKILLKSNKPVTKII